MTWRCLIAAIIGAVLGALQVSLIDSEDRKNQKYVITEHGPIKIEDYR